MSLSLRQNKARRLGSEGLTPPRSMALGDAKGRSVAVSSLPDDPDLEEMADPRRVMLLKVRGGVMACLSEAL